MEWESNIYIYIYNITITSYFIDYNVIKLFGAYNLMVE